MNWRDLGLLIVFVLSFLLIVLTTVTLVKTWRGTRYKVLLAIVALLLCANIGYLINCVGTYFFYKYLQAEDKDKKFQSVVALSFGQGFGDLCFCTGHWLLAFYYFKIAKNMPRVVRGNE